MKQLNTASAEDVAVVQSNVQSEDYTTEKSSRGRGGRGSGLEPAPGKHRNPVGCTDKTGNDAQTNRKCVHTKPGAEAGVDNKLVFY